MKRGGCIIIVLIICLHCWYGTSASASGTDRPFPTRPGLSVSAGHIYDPNVSRDQMALLTGYLLLDHDRAAFFSTPDYLRFKLEASVGAGRDTPWRGFFAVNMLSLCYLDFIATDRLRPYLEGGIGLMYSRRRWEGQGLHFTHNPVAGAGVLISPREAGHRHHMSVRLFHASNGGLHSSNKAMNAVLLSTGVLF